MNDTTKKGKQASVDGFAHEHIAVGLLVKKISKCFSCGFTLISL